MDGTDARLGTEVHAMGNREDIGGVAGAVREVWGGGATGREKKQEKRGLFHSGTIMALFRNGKAGVRPAGSVAREEAGLRVGG